MADDRVPKNLQYCTPCVFQFMINRGKDNNLEEVFRLTDIEKESTRSHANFKKPLHIDDSKKYLCCEAHSNADSGKKYKELTETQQQVTGEFLRQLLEEDFEDKEHIKHDDP